jgi:hypothetical protein
LSVGHVGESHYHLLTRLADIMTTENRLVGRGDTVATSSVSGLARPHPRYSVRPCVWLPSLDRDPERFTSVLSRHRCGNGCSCWVCGLGFRLAHYSKRPATIPAAEARRAVAAESRRLLAGASVGMLPASVCRLDCVDRRLSQDTRILSCLLHVCSGWRISDSWGLLASASVHVVRAPT